MERGPPRESVVERAHSERLQLAGAADKAEARAADFAPVAVGSRRSMTMSEAHLIQPSGQAVICSDVAGRITHWNRAAEAMYGWRAGEAVGQGFVELLSPSELKEKWAEILKRVGGGVSWRGPAQAVRRDGGVVGIYVTNTPIVDHEERITGVVGIFSEDAFQAAARAQITRSRSSEGFVDEGESESLPQTGSDDGKSMRRRAQLEAEIQAARAAESSDEPSNAAASSNLVKIGESMQQLLRSFQSFGTKVPRRDGRAERREQSGKESETDSSARAASHPFGAPVEGFQISRAGKESGDSQFGEWKSKDAAVPGKLVVPAKQLVVGEGGSWESFTSQDTGKDASVSSLAAPQMGPFDQSLSRSSSGSVPGSAGRDLSSAGSPVERSLPESTWGVPAAAGLNFQQAEEDFQLQSALALRVAAEAAAVDDPDLSSNLPSAGAVAGVGRVEATAYRYWVSCCLSYDDRIEDGFYEVWGMSPYVWGMCTDASQLGRMPTLENLRAVSPKDATFEVVLVDRSMDPTLIELEDKAVGLAYKSSEVLVMASELSIMVAKVMGGASASDEAWRANTSRLAQVLGTVVLPIGQLSIGLTRHRALLFKVLADSVGLPCRLIRGQAFCDNEEGAAVIVKCGDEKEWMIDLLLQPGAIMPPDKRLTVPPPAIPSPLQFERPNSFASANVSVQHWTRDSPNPKDLGSRGGSPRAKNSPQVTSFTELGPVQGSPQTVDDAGSQGRLDFARSASSKSRWPGEDGARGNYELNNPSDKVRQTDFKLASPAAGGDFLLEDIALGRPLVVGGVSQVLRKSEPSWAEASKAAARDEQGWPKPALESVNSDAPWAQIPGDAARSALRDKYDWPKEELPKMPPPWPEAARVAPKDDRDWLQGTQFGNVRKSEPSWAEYGRPPSRDERGGPRGGQDSRKSEVPWREAPRDRSRDDRGMAKDSRQTGGSDESMRSSGAGRIVDQLVAEINDFEIGWDDVVLGERIGQGSYGRVYRGDWQGSDVAVKVFLDQDLKVEALEEFKSEVALMLRLRHPNVVLFMGAVTKPPNLSIITEFCPRGSLYRLLHRPNRELDDRKRIRMALDVAKGMNYLHRCSPPVVHRDLKSPNLLVDKNWTVKVCDFGLSRQKHSTFLSCKSSAGTPEWMAPEVLRNEPSDEKSDVYSFGVILWELATLQVPWNGMNPIQVVGAVGFQHRRLAIPDNIDPGIAELISACWRGETHLRPTFADIMQELKVLHQKSMQGTPRAQSAKADDD